MVERFDIIYADPPWYKCWTKKGALKKSAECHYDVMDIADIRGKEMII